MTPGVLATAHNAAVAVSLELVYAPDHGSPEFPFYVRVQRQGEHQWQVFRRARSRGAALRGMLAAQSVRDPWPWAGLSPW